MNNYLKKDSFKDWNEYDNFLANLKFDTKWHKLDSYNSDEIDLGFLKLYFKNVETDEIWELAEPDPPFRGGWKKYV